jgi:hypothetical protein
MSRAGIPPPAHGGNKIKNKCITQKAREAEEADRVPKIDKG